MFALNDCLVTIFKEIKIDSTIGFELSHPNLKTSSFKVSLTELLKFKPVKFFKSFH